MNASRVVWIMVCAAALSGASLLAQQPAPAPETFDIMVAGPAGAAGPHMVAAGAGFGVTMAPQHATVQFLAAERAYAGSMSPLKDEPYTAEGVSEFTQILGDGTRISRKSSTKMARDSQGRSRTERSEPMIGPFATDESLPTVFINDPVAKQTVILNQTDKTAQRIPMPELPEWVQEEAAKGAPAGETRGIRVERSVIVHRAIGARPGIAAGAAGGAAFVLSSDNVNTESLGQRTISGVVCDGTRTTNTIPAGQIGNDRELQTVTETWFSQDLQLTVMSKTSDPLTGETTFRLDYLSRAEPAPSLFEIPSDYTIQENGEGPAGRVFMQRIEKKQ